MKLINSAKFTAVIDANVLFPVVIRDYLIWLSIISSINLPDENDRHVVAAAMKCNANIIVTWNLSDFPNEYLATIGLTATDPDSFIADMVDLSPQKCCDAFREMVLTKKNPSYEELEYVEVIRRNQLSQTAQELTKYLNAAGD